MKRIIAMLYETGSRMLVPWLLFVWFNSVVDLDAVFQHNREVSSGRGFAMTVVFACFMVAWFQACWRVWDVVKQVFRR